MKPDDLTVPLWIAAHEAGHAVAMLALAGNNPKVFTTVQVFPCDPDPPSWPYSWNGKTMGRTHGFKGAVTSLAGPIAEFRVRGCEWGSINDLSERQDYFRALDDCLSAFQAGEVADPLAANDQAFQEARDIIELNWAAVLAVAAALQERRSLTSRQTLRLIKDAGCQISVTASNITSN